MYACLEFSKWVHSLACDLGGVNARDSFQCMNEQIFSTCYQIAWIDKNRRPFSISTYLHLVVRSLYVFHDERL
jgi:hypothetical protein